MITNKLYHRLRKFARGNIDFIEDFSLGHAENLPPKWQSRAAKIDKVGAHEWKKELSAKIVSLQRADGSWANENNRFWESDPVLCTSFALLALELCR